MKLSTLRKHHKWFGLIIGLPLVLLCISGIVLNHRSVISSIDVSRGSLPEEYKFKNWNNGLMRGTISLDSTQLLVYGKAGVFSVNRQTDQICDYNAGFPEGVDNRTVNRIVKAGDGKLYAVAQYGLFYLERERWERVESVKTGAERLVDITVSDDSSVIVLGRSHIYKYNIEEKESRTVTLPAAKGEEPRISLFRVVWTLHSGEMFGMAGKLFVDIMALLFIFLFVSGVIIWILPRIIKKHVKNKIPFEGKAKSLKWNISWHDKLGRYTIIFTLFVAFSGWLLRPPMLVAIMGHDISTQPDQNAWEDKLRALQYDADKGDFILSTSDGFYILDQIESQPYRSVANPPVSVMGINVLQKQQNADKWLVGSFSGLYLWDRVEGSSIDVLTGMPVDGSASSMPMGNLKVSGYSIDFGNPVICSYDEGIIGEGQEIMPQPEWMETLPMSLWNLALEVHTGRIFTFMGIFSTLLYIFIVGMAVMYLLYTGWKIRMKKII